MSAAFVAGAPVEANAAVARELKAGFPAFAGPDGYRGAYLDNAATTQKPLAVLEAEAAFYRDACANVHRAVHARGEEATLRYEAARTRLSRFLGATSARELVFVRGATEGINLVARTLGETFVPGDEIVLSEMEHHANLVPWQQLAARRGVVLRFARVSEDGEFDFPHYASLLGPRTRLVSLTMSSNVLGTVMPVKRLAELARGAGALFMADAAQAAPRMKLDVRALGIDLLAFSGHKMYGPFGIGGLWGREAVLDAMPPFLGGGEMIREVRLDGFEPNELPHKFEAGTMPIAQAVALAAAADWLEGVGIDALGAYESALAGRLAAALEALGARVLGWPRGRAEAVSRERAGIVAFELPGVHAHDLAAFLDRNGAALRAGHHCAHPLAAKLGVASSARASFGAYNLPEEVDLVASLVARAKEEL